MVLQTSTQHHVLVTSRWHGFFTDRQRAKLKNHFCTLTARRIMDVSLEQEFCTLVGRLFVDQVRLPKRVVIARCGKLSRAYTNCQHQRSKSFFNKASQGRWLSFRSLCWVSFKYFHSTLQSRLRCTFANVLLHRNTKRRLLASSAKLARRESTTRQIFCIPLQTHPHVNRTQINVEWAPGCTRVAKSRIELVDNKAQPAHLSPYGAELKSKESKKIKIDKLSSQKLIEPAHTEWAINIVSDSNKDETLRSCVNYRKFNRVTKRDSYSISQLDACIYSLGKAAMSSTLGA